MSVVLTVDRPDELWGVPLHLEVSGLEADTEVDLVVELTDSTEQRWSAASRYRASAERRVATSTDEPLSGPLRRHELGVLPWLILSPETEARGMFPRNSSEPVRVRAACLVNGDEVAEAEATRRYADPALRPVRFEGQGYVLSGFVEDTEERPGVLYVSGSDGGIAEGMAALLSSAGLACAAVGYFGVPGLPEDLKEVDVGFLDRAARAWRNTPGVRDTPVGLVGYSRGGELVLLAGSIMGEEVGAVVGYVPSGVVWGVISADPTVTGPAWTIGGRPVEPLPYADTEYYDGHGRLRYTPVYHDALDADQAATDAHTIAAEKITAPVLMISGDQDELWPSTRLSGYAERRLAQRPGDIPVRHLVLKDAGHEVAVPGAPATRHDLVHPVIGTRMLLGGTDLGQAEGSVLAFAEVTNFLRTHLEPS